MINVKNKYIYCPFCNKKSLAKKWRFKNMELTNISIFAEFDIYMNFKNKKPFKCPLCSITLLLPFNLFYYFDISKYKEV